ncbi:MAG TPA: DUF72 domain-containing protein [Mucilaginibacter sp.]|jgi:uncharacterized protein YecE (DUF72 family)|nr:DUF72 domain-containing protein [Mucilaginibacter sp.]
MSTKNRGKIYTGTSGLVLPLPNRRSFPPEMQNKSRLEIYSSIFNSIEINSCFYKVPMASTVEKWAASVPDDFKFTFKLWRQITHNKELILNPAEIDLFMRTIAHAGDKKGCLLIQFPPSITIASISQLEKLLTGVKHADELNEWKVVVEFRNRSWYEDEAYALLAQYHTGVVLHDMPSSAITLLETSVNYVYLRFHGPNGGYRGSYNDDFLYEYAQYIKEWNIGGKEVYVYFNNTMGDAVKNLATLNKYIDLK